MATEGISHNMSPPCPISNGIMLRATPSCNLGDFSVEMREHNANTWLA